MRTLVLSLAFGVTAAHAADAPPFPATLAGQATLPALTLLQPPADAPALFRMAGRFTAADRVRVETLGTIPTTAFTSDKAAPRSSGVGLPLAGQPAQGMSGIVATGPDSFLLLSDNGFGSRVNSPDSLLMLHRAKADWTAGTIVLTETLFLRDPDKVLPFAIRNEATAERYLTGADLDTESLAVVGDRWFIGDEFGPYLVELDRTGKVVAFHETLVDGKPARSPDHFMLGQLPATPSAVPFAVRRSRGFEPMSAAPDGSRIVAMFEGPLFDEKGEPEAFLRLVEFDPASGSWTGRQWRYRPADPANVIGDLAFIDRDTALVIERDDASEGAPSQACPAEPRPDCFNKPAAFKRVYKIDLAQADADGFVRKVGYVDLLDIADPDSKAHVPLEPSGRFVFPYQGPEGVAVVGPDLIAVINDNNLPYNAGRRIGQPDGSELIVLRVPELMAAR
ncbi:MAG: esterase-like activity of phytase family protein [Geminicoccaceae bacterium]